MAPIQTYTKAQVDTLLAGMYTKTEVDAAIASAIAGVGSVLLGTYDAAGGVASLDITTRNAPGKSGAIFQSDIHIYEFDFDQLRPQNDVVNFLSRISEDGGSTWKSGASDYYWQYFTQSTTITTPTGQIDSQLQLANSVNNLANRSVNGMIRLIGPGSALHKSVKISLNAAAASGQYEFTGGGLVLRTAASNAIQFYFSSGNIASGIIRVSGRQIPA